MLNNSGRKILLGVVAGTLLSTAISTVLAADKETYNLLDSQGKPVLTGANHSKPCVQTPSTANQPATLFKECGDVLDSDGDGVPDDEDGCPNNTPDEISKGVYDDKGRKTKDDVENRKPVDPNKDRVGCPIDTDGDTIEDYRDKCPNTEERIVLEDQKRRGDKCIFLTGSRETLGCDRDSDGDGINDCFDKCPNTPSAEKSTIDKEGCGRAKDLAGGEVLLLVGDVTFAFNKFDLTPQAQATLNEFAGRALGNLNSFKDLLVSGHTDSVGGDAYNQKLSEKRAKAVANYLISKGVPANKVAAVGKGEKEPVDDNKTKEGRAKNRRVVILVR